MFEVICPHTDFYATTSSGGLIVLRLCHIARPNSDSVGFLSQLAMTSFPICARSGCVAWVSTGHLSVHTHTRMTQCFASETRDQQVLPPGVSAMPCLFILTLRSESLHFYLTQEWDSIFVYMAVGSCVICVCVGQMACGSNPKWNRPSFVGDIMTYLEWFLEGLVALTPETFPPTHTLLYGDLKVVVCAWGCARAVRWAPRLVPVNNDFSPASLSGQSKSFLQHLPLCFLLL